MVDFPQKINKAIRSMLYDDSFNPKIYDKESYDIDAIQKDFDQIISELSELCKSDNFNIDSIKESQVEPRECLPNPIDVDCVFETSEYSLDYGVIENLFNTANVKFSLYSIYQRLAIIDLFYGTNVGRMRQYGIQELSCAIWKLCSDSKNNYSDQNLVDRVSQFIANPTPQNPIVSELFNKNYGYIINQGISSNNAVSLISKYLYFLMQTKSKGYGFPIYDSMVCELAPCLAEKLRITINPNCKKDICEFIKMMKNIVDKLVKSDSQLWNQLNTRKTYFGLLDHFLWRVGKVGHFSFSLLLSKSEIFKHVNTLSLIHEYLKQSKKIKKGKPYDKQVYKILIVKEMQKLPTRILAWYIQYYRLKN